MQPARQQWLPAQAIDGIPSHQKYEASRRKTEKRQEREAARSDPKILGTLNALLADDIRFYEQTLERAYARPPSFINRAFSRFQSRLASVARLS